MVDDIKELYKFNKYQTQLTEEVKESVPREVWSELIDFLSSVEFIKRLVDVEDIRGYAKDKPRETKFYNDGRVDVNLTNPHILENMDFFRQRALFFEKHSKYTHLTPNPNPKSEYGLFWKEELHRWKYGLIRESDGEWIPGQLYFYWNYSPIWLVEIVKTENKGKKQKGERVRKFPKPWLGDYLFYHYIQQARDGGMHGKLLKTRGVGFEQPNSEIVKTINGDVKIGDVKIGDKLISIDGLETNVIEIYHQGLKDVYEVELHDGRKVKCGLDHLWYVNDYTKRKIKPVKLSEMISKGLTWRINNGKNVAFKYKIPKLQPIEYPGKELKIPPYVLGVLLGDGTLTGSTIKVATNDQFIIEEFERLLPSFELRQDKSNNNYICVDKDRFIKKDSNTQFINYQYGVNILKREIQNLGLEVTCFKKFIPNTYKFGSIDQRLELLKGLMDSDGYVNKNGNKEFSNSNLTLIKDVADVVRSLGMKCRISEGRQPRTKIIFNKECNVNQEYRLHIITNDSIFKLPRKIERCKIRSTFEEYPIVNITKLDYQEESSCFLVDNNTHTYLTNDFVPTHNSFKMGAISPCNMFVYPGSGNPNFHLASEKTFLAGDKGIWGKVVDTLDWIAESTPLPRMRTVDRAGSTLEIQLGFKDEYGIRKGLLSSVHGISLKDNPDKARGIRGPLIHYEEDGLFPNLEKAWNVNLKAVEDGDVGFGFMLAGGTGGVEGGSFEGSEKLFYNTAAYEIYGVPNVFDKNTKGDTKCGFFWGGYLNRNGCYDEEVGEPDIIKALLQILTNRYKIKYNSQDPNSITQKKAEEPITPQEAIMRTEGTVFPVSDLKDYLESIMVKKESFLAEHYVGELIRGGDGKLKWRLNNDKFPLRSYDKDNANRAGCLEIFEMPAENANGEVATGRYIAGIDPIDADSGTSLFSIKVMDLFTDRIVAEFSGRPRLAEEAYEIALRVLEFYNAVANYEKNLKGLFSYFDKKNALFRLCDTPQILKDMQMTKDMGYGNSSKGTTANLEVNKWGRKLQADWMNTSIEDEDNPGKLKLHTLRGLAYIEECIKWNSDGNFDRVSAGGMLFILREDRYKRTQSAIQNQGKSIDHLANDKFFNRNFNRPNAMNKNQINY